MDAEEVSAIKANLDTLGEDTSTNTFSPPAKRVTHTYVRRRDPLDAADPDTSSSSFSLSSRLSLDGFMSADTSLDTSITEEEEGDTSPLSAYRFSWRDKLDQVDEAYDAAVESESHSGFDASQILSGQLSLPFELHVGSPPSTKPETPITRDEATDESILLPRPPLFLSDSDEENPKSPLVKKRGPRRRALTLSTPPSCSNSPQRVRKASSLPSSPSQLSDAQSQRPGVLPTAKARGKKKARNLDVRPLEFNESGKVKEGRRKEAKVVLTQCFF
jgi:hypothetical protein